MPPQGHGRTGRATGSIQKRLTAYIVAGAAVLLVIAGIAVDHMIRRQLAFDFDDNLLYKATGLVGLAERENRMIEFNFSYDYMPEFDALENKKMEYFQLSFADGSTVAKSRSLGSGSLPRDSSAFASPSYRNVRLPDGRKGRMVSFGFAPEVHNDDDEDSDAANAAAGGNEEVTRARMPESLPTDSGLVISVARGTEPLAQLVDTIRIILASTCLALMAAVWLLVRYSVRRGLGPLRRIADEVRSLDSTKLHTQLTTDPGSEELQPITDQLNHLLERLHDAFEREKRFSGNVAHELRTPIAELRTLAEVGKRWPGDQAMVKQFFGDLINLADDMERTVTNLLSLARLDAGQQSVDLESVELAGVIEKCWKQTAVEADSRAVVLDNRVARELRVTTDEDKLALIVVNLFSNAVSYSPPGSTIVVQAQKADSGVQLSVSNLTVDLTEGDLPLMFDRFWRKDKARTKGRYAGLGLSLVKALGEILQLTVLPELDRNGTLTMTLEGFEPA